MPPLNVKYLLAAGCLAVLACETPSIDTKFGASNSVGLYLEGVKPLLQDLRVLDRQIEDAVPADSVDSHVIVPLIEERFLPQLMQLRGRAQQLPTTAKLLATNRKLLAYLDLRIEAYDLVLEGARENRPELFAAFYNKQIEADTAARVFETSLRQVQDSLN
jgi:hypothetical protein